VKGLERHTSVARVTDVRSAKAFILSFKKTCATDLNPGPAAPGKVAV